MEGSSSGKLSSQSNRITPNKTSHITDGKSKRSRKKKKNKRSSGKTDRQSAVKFASDEEKGTLGMEEVTPLEKECLVSEDSSSTLDPTLKLPLLVSGMRMPTSTDGGDAKESIRSLPSKSIPPSSEEASVDVMSQGINNIVLKHKPTSKSNSRTRHSGKQNGSKQAKGSKNSYKLTPQDDVKQFPAGYSFISNFVNPEQLISRTASSNNESLRWDDILEDSDEERERIRLYKINRRKRYLAAAQVKGLSWALTCNQSSSFQFPDDIGLDSLRTAPSSYTDYRPIKNLQVSQAHIHSMIGAASIEC